MPPSLMLALATLAAGTPALAGIHVLATVGPAPPLSSNTLVPLGAVAASAVLLLGIAFKAGQLQRSLTRDREEARRSTASVVELKAELHALRHDLYTDLRRAQDGIADLREEVGQLRGLAKRPPPHHERPGK